MAGGAQSDAAMHPFCRLAVLLLPLLPIACVSPARLVSTRSDQVVSVAAAADELVRADVIVLGEDHESGPVHRMHHELLAALHARRPELVIAMEMFERDVQQQVLLYLNGLIDEGDFRASARPWPNYASDYRPVIEFARQNRLIVLAANAPRPLAKQAAEQGVASVLGDHDVARETTAPEDDYYDAFVEAMHGHVGAGGDGAMQRLYAAQCLKDDTMAETIVDHLQASAKDVLAAAAKRPLVVLICGRMHSDHGRGVVARIKSRLPGADVRVLSSELVTDLSAGIYRAPRTIGDFVVVAEGTPDAEDVVAKPVTAQPKVDGAPALPPHHPPVAGAKPEGGAAPAHPAAGGASSGGDDADAPQPALGLMADYGYQGGDGVRVENVRDGGPAAEAGIEAGDLIRALAGEQVADFQSYAEVLRTLKVGQQVTVRVRREGAEVDLQVKVGARSR